MSHPGRKPQGAQLVEELKGSAHARQRAALFLETLAGEKTVGEACAELGVGESRFFALRGEWLQQGVEFLEPKPAGRPPKIEPPESAELRQLRRRVRAFGRRAAGSADQRRLACGLAAARPREGRKKGDPTRKLAVLARPFILPVQCNFT